MFQAPKRPVHPDVTSSTKAASIPEGVEHKAALEASRAVAPLAPEVNNALWEGAALLAVYHGHIDAPIPSKPEHGATVISEQPAKPPAAVAPEDKKLSKELLDNDSLGG